MTNRDVDLYDCLNSIMRESPKEEGLKQVRSVLIWAFGNNLGALYYRSPRRLTQPIKTMRDWIDLYIQECQAKKYISWKRWSKNLRLLRP
jgi:abortive infection bacteriophage resistance protein